MLRTEAYEWFNATDRKDWNDWSMEAAQKEIDNWQNPDTNPGTAEELYEMMAEIIAEYDELNK